MKVQLLDCFGITFPDNTTKYFVGLFDDPNMLEDKSLIQKLITEGTHIGDTVDEEWDISIYAYQNAYYSVSGFNEPTYISLLTPVTLS